MNARFKIIIFILIIAVAAGNIVFTPKKTEAFWGIGDISFDPINYAVNLKDFALMLVKDTYRGLRDQASKRIIDSIVNDTARWIENGGEPRFVTDWEKFMKDAGGKAVGDVIKETDLAFVCSPFKVQLQFALRQSYNYQQQISCTLDQVVNNIEAFYDDFSQGGWVGYNRMWGSGGNFYSTYLVGIDEMVRRSEEEKETAKNEALAGSGFLPVKRCVLYDETDEDLDGNTDECLEYVTVTPGRTVADASANAITADTQWATNIESWTSVLTNALVNRLTKEGVGWLKSTTQDFFEDDGDSGSIVSGESTAAGYSTSTQQLAVQKIESENKEMTTELQKFIDFDWEYVLHLKNESLAYTELRFEIATSIEAMADSGTVESCALPFGFQYRVKTIESQVKRLEKEIQNLQENIDIHILLANQLITEINLAVNLSERANIQQKYSDFISENDLGGVESYVILAEQEWQDNKTTFDEIRKRYKDKCGIGFILTPEYKERLNVR